MARLRASWRTSLPVVQQPRNPQSESIARSPYHAHRRRSSGAAGPFSGTVSTPWSASGDRHLGSSLETNDILFARLQELPELVLSALSRHAARTTTPAGTSPVVTIRHSAISSFLASATIRVLRVPPRASAVRARYHCASALSF